MMAITSWEEAVDRATLLKNADARVMLGITGAPGAGKSTLASALVEALGESVQSVGMDGFHLTKSRLAQLGRLDRMGAIDTFDAAGFVALVRRLRGQSDTTIYAPEFRRATGEAIAGAIAVRASTKLVIVEGNYLLASESPWCELRDLLDEFWYCERDEQSRIESLIARQQELGQSEAAARDWALGSDETNAERVRATKPLADVIVALEHYATPTSSPETAAAAATATPISDGTR